MKALFALSLVLLANGNAFIDFHKEYINKIKRVSELPHKLRLGSCPSFSCTSSPSSWPEGQCLKYTSSSRQYELKVCEDGQFCPWAWHSSDVVSDCITQAPFAYAGMPGDACASKDECQGLSRCVDSVCVGQGVDEECDDQPDCDVGLVCFNILEKAKCVPQNAEGEACGSYITMDLCKNNLACNFNKCEAVFSKGIGISVDATVAPTLCSSGFWTYNDYSSGTAICIDPPKSPYYPSPPECAPGSYCLSSDGVWAMPCECGFNNNGKAYCPPFPGDDLYQTYFEKMKSYLSSSEVNKCHYLDIGQYECPHNNKDTLDELFNAKREIDFYTKRLGNDECVKSIITYSYWNSETS